MDPQQYLLLSRLEVLAMDPKVLTTSDFPEIMSLDFVGLELPKLGYTHSNLKQVKTITSGIYFYVFEK